MCVLRGVEGGGGVLLQANKKKQKQIGGGGSNLSLYSVCEKSCLIFLSYLAVAKSFLY